jgi:hypothetical protein
VAPDGFRDYPDERVGGSVGKKDEIETKGVTASKRNRASQTESPDHCFGG